MSSLAGRGTTSRRRVRGARVLSWVLALVAAVPMFGLVDLGTVFGLSNPQYLWAVSLEASWGSLFTFFIAAGFAWTGAFPQRPWPGLGLVGLAGAALAIASALFADAGPLWVAVALVSAATVLVVLLRPGWRAIALEQPPGPWSVGAALGVPLWLGYAWHTYAAARGVGLDVGDVTMGVDHWPVQVALGLALTAGSAVLATGTSRLALWHGAFALSAGFVAYATLAFPDRAGAMPHGLWGVAMAAWAVLLAGEPLARALFRGRSSRATASR